MQFIQGNGDREVLGTDERYGNSRSSGTISSSHALEAKQLHPEHKELPAA
jgi:hypothetical protein